MNKNTHRNLLRAFKLLALVGIGLCLLPLLKADVVLLQNGGVLTGTVLQQDADGVLIQTDTGTYRYPLSWVQDVKKEAATARHVANNGRRIPDWAQIVSMLASTSWSQGMKQVPATVINYGKYNSVPYISFRCAAGGYELNIFGDLNAPAAVEIGAMNYLKQSDEAKSNCVNFICSLLPNADDRKMVRALNWNQPVTNSDGGMMFETLIPGEWGSYGGWWVSVYDQSALASAQASQAELASLTQSRTAPAQPMAAPAQSTATAANTTAQPGAANPQPAAASDQPVTTTTQPITTYGATYGAYPGWTAEEMAAARPVAPAPYPTATGDMSRPSSASDQVYPRTYDRSAGSYGAHRR
ncbi:MAG: hypothetical protein WAO02_10110 [Verrucomicrobiia bacterium]